MSSKFGTKIERIIECFDGEFTIHDVRYHLGADNTIENDTKIRYHLNRLGCNKTIYSTTNYYSFENTDSK